MSADSSHPDPAVQGRQSRRDFLKVGAAGLAGATLAAPAAAQLPGLRSATPRELQNLVGDGRRRRILLKGGVVLSLDPRVGDFEKADVLIDGKTIAQVAPNIAAGDAEVVDCAGTIVMPGFITTHHHQYETLQRSIIPDGLLGGAWPQESYGSVVQNIWTAGRIAEPGTRANPSKVIWDLGRVPYDPEDLYISEIGACLSEISEGITCGTDTSQANHTPAHTDAMIKGLMDSGRRMVFDYSGGTNRSAEGFPYEVPGAMNDTTKGIGRIAKTYFSSKDQLVSLGFGGGAGPAFPGADYTGWQLGRSFGAFINNHSFGNGNAIVNAAADPRNGTDWSDVTFVHATRWQDEPFAQIGANNAEYPNSGHVEGVGNLARSRRACLDGQPHRDADAAWDAAVPGGAQSRHPAQPEPGRRRKHDDRRVLADAGRLLPAARAGQRPRLQGEQSRNLPVPQLLTSRQCIEMVTIAGAAANRLLDKVGTLTPGKEADIVVLEARSINTWPMNNVPGTIVTMMNPRHVRDVLIAGKVVYWKGRLVGWNVERVLTQLQQARDRVLARINGPAKVGAIPKGNNSFSNPYRPNFLDSCCYKGQNTDVAGIRVEALTAALLQTGISVL